MSILSIIAIHIGNNESLPQIRLSFPSCSPDSTNVESLNHPIHSTARRVTHSIGSSISQALDSTSSWLDVACAKWRFHHGFTMVSWEFYILKPSKVVKLCSSKRFPPSLYPFLSPISIYWFIIWNWSSYIVCLCWNATINNMLKTRGPSADIPIEDVRMSVIHIEQHTNCPIVSDVVSGYSPKSIVRWAAVFKDEKLKQLWKHQPVVSR